MSAADLEDYLRVIGGAEMRELDRLAIDECGLPGLALMENAGRAVARAALDLLCASARAPGSRAPRVLIVAGKGNNAGDGFVAARHLLAAGCDVGVALADPEAEPADGFTGDARLHLDILRRDGCWTRLFTHLDPQATPPPDLIIDAVLGTGLAGPPRGPAAAAIAAINRIASSSGCPVLAVDVPSGVDSETGGTPGEAVRATHTVTFAYLKSGLVSHPGAERAGKVLVAGIGLPPSIGMRIASDIRVLGPAGAAALLPPRPPAAHKGTFGHVLTVAGSRGYSGAAWLCAVAALRAGAGLSTLASTPETLDLGAGSWPEVMTSELPPDGGPYSTVVGEFDAVALGPGLGTSAAARHLVSSLLGDVLAAGRATVVIDADGLNALAADGPETPFAASAGSGLDILHRVARGSTGLVLTPHPGELARLAGTAVAAIQADRLTAALKAAAALGAVVCLKGARTIVASPTGAARLIPFGNPGMATGGSGDVLTGVVAGLLAGGMTCFDAACLGAFTHALAGDLAAGAAGGEAGLLAGDIMKQIPAALGMTRRGEVVLESIGRLSW